MNLRPVANEGPQPSPRRRSHTRCRDTFARRYYKRHSEALKPIGEHQKAWKHAAMVKKGVRATKPSKRQLPLTSLKGWRQIAEFSPPP